MMEKRPSKLNLGLQDDLLEALAEFEVLTVKDLTKLHTNDTKHSTVTTYNKSLKSLHNHGLVNKVYFLPEGYKGRGNNPNAWGLSKDGVALTEEKWPYTYPKVFSASHSPHTIQHDLNRARTHIAIADLCEKNEWDLGWQKGGYHLVKPDDVFEITKGEKTAHFFLEEEHKKKDYAAMYEKLKPYVDLFGTGDIKNEWGFRHYTVIIPMRDEDAMQNLLIHFKGGCNCVDPRQKYMHKNGPFKLYTDVLWFTTHEAITANPGGDVFLTSKGNRKSIADLMQ